MSPSRPWNNFSGLGQENHYSSVHGKRNLPDFRANLRDDLHGNDCKITVDLEVAHAR